MKYLMYRLSFPAGVHFGNKSLDESNYTFCADTLFSALYIESLKHGEDFTQWFLQKVKRGDILFSDALPYIGDINYLPKPLKRVDVENSRGDSEIKKAFKSLLFIPMDKMKTYLDGKLDAEFELNEFKKLGKHSIKTSAAIRGNEETKPYHIGIYSFNNNCGLYFIVGISDEVDEDKLYDLIDSLSFSGIGGKKSSGFGRFELEKLQTIDSKYFEGDGQCYMTLSISLPIEEEMEHALEDASYQIKKRSGFVFSSVYAEEQRKKKDMFLFGSGSCFKNRFRGDIYDVSDGGKHSVYRYAKPLFWVM